MAFGRPLAKFQGIQMALADAATRLQAARLLCLNAPAILDAGRRAPCDVSMAKLFAVETAIRTCQTAIESMGAWGLAVDAGVDRCWRGLLIVTPLDGAPPHARPYIPRA